MLSKILSSLFGQSQVAGVDPDRVSKQLARLGEIGIRLNPDVDQETTADLVDPRRYRHGSWPELLTVLGGEPPIDGYGEPRHWPSDDIWFFTTNDIVNPGDYAVFVERVRDLSHGRLPLVDIRDSIGGEEDGNSISFRLEGKDYRWTLNADDPDTTYVDPELWFLLEDLLKDAGISDLELFTCLQDSDGWLIMTTAEKAKALSELTGMDFD